MNEPPAPRRTALALMAHPDDAEFLCGGTLILLSDLGWEIHIASATAGDCGSTELAPDEIARIRRTEARRAAALVGGAYHSLERRDLEVFYERETLRAACGLLRRVSPDLVVTHSPSDYMLDHEEISRVARAACFNAPIRNAPAPEGSRPLKQVPALYYADPVEGVDPFGRAVLPAILVDITGVMDRKKQMLAAHASQRDWLRRHHGMDEYIDSMMRWVAERGALGGVAFAEGLRQHLGHAYPREDILSAALGARTRRLDPPETGGTRDATRPDLDP